MFATFPTVEFAVVTAVFELVETAVALDAFEAVLFVTIFFSAVEEGI